MRTNIEIDNELIKTAMELTGIRTKKDIVDEALRRLVRLERQAEIKNYYGKLHWEGDLNEIRTGKRGNKP